LDIKSNEQAFLENGDLIGQVLEINESLDDIQKWYAADDTLDVSTDTIIEDALHDVQSLYRRLIDLQIKLLTNL